TVVGADPESSRYGGGDGSPYFVESIGHFVHPETVCDLWPESFDTAVVDRFERIPDRESLLTARRLGREEGLLAGASSGTAIAAALRVARDLTANDLVVVLLPDSGRSYLSKSLSDDWLRQWGFLEEPGTEPLVRDVLDRPGQLVTVATDCTAGGALERLAGVDGAVPVVQARDGRRYGVSASEIVGSVSARGLRAVIAGGRGGCPVTEVLEEPLPTVGVGQPVTAALAAFGGRDAAIALIDGRARAIVTRTELERVTTAPTSVITVS
ncbi:MAG TPA: pyridoxal-phosphate dependent enzyme, partial [Pseudonocardiaceae bacterium]|nr:pyridoxal-phosphate dependent enzyme [Pseudonocardiaceae bacterium]